MLGLAVQPIRDGPIPDPAGGDWPPAANPNHGAAAANIAEPAEAAEPAPHDPPAPAGEAGEPEVGLEDVLVNGGDPTMLANDLNIPEFSTEESQLLEGMLWGYSSDPPSCTLWGASVPAAGDGIESPPPPMPEAVENGSSSPVPCISLLDDSPGLSAEKAAMPSTFSHDMKRAEFNDYKKFLALAKEKLAEMKRRDSHLGAEVFTSLLFSPPGQELVFPPQMMASCPG